MSVRAAADVPARPAEVVALPAPLVLDRLRDRVGDLLDLAIATAASGAPDADVPASLHSPIAGEPGGRWLRRANIVGVNVRTVGDLLGVLAYAMTLPRIQNSVHLLPIWEPGVVGSLYAPVSWNIDPELRSEAWAAACPGLDTVEKQLGAVVHILHAMGKTVGIDVVPHVDRYSEIALAGPDLFEWLRRRGTRIVEHGPRLVGAVEGAIVSWLGTEGSATGGRLPGDPGALFRGLDESSRLELLFGWPGDAEGRRHRRISLVRALHDHGLETVPATMGPPYRGIEPDPRPEAVAVDGLGLEWREYRMLEPGPTSRVFGPLTRYALWEARGDGWALDFDRPRAHVWDYVADHVAAFRRDIPFDFMRGDMAHVQMRESGVPDPIPARYDLFGYVKRRVREATSAPSFGSFAESFLAPRDTFSYGVEIEHLEAAESDAALGDLQSVPTDDPEFRRRLRQYIDLGAIRSCAPSLTVMTADKDDPRFDAAYRAGSAVRLFVSLLVPDLPSYMALGFESRDVHDRPAANEFYSKLYVFRQSAGPNVTVGPYRWGHNDALLAAVTRIRAFADEISADLASGSVRWLLPPDPTDSDAVIAWLIEGRTRWLCVANLDGRQASGQVGIPRAAVPAAPEAWDLAFDVTEPLADARSAADEARQAHPVSSILRSNGPHWPMSAMPPGAGLVFRPRVDRPSR